VGKRRSLLAIPSTERLGAGLDERDVCIGTRTFLIRTGFAEKESGLCECARSAGWRGRNSSREFLALRSVHWAHQKTTGASNKEASLRESSERSTFMACCETQKSSFELATRVTAVHRRAGLF
jgi:hypothetical protein